MSRRLLPALLGTLMVAAAGCQPGAQPLSQADRDANQQVSDRFLQLVRAQDWGALSELYTMDAVRLPPNQSAVRGRAAIREWMTQFPPMEEFSFTTDAIEGAGDLAYVYGHYQMTLALEGMPVDSGKFVEIRRRQPDGSWTVAVEIFNSSVPLPMEH